MKTDKLMQDHAAWQAADRLLNGARSSCASETRADSATAAHRVAWQQMIDRTLTEWARKPSQLDEPETVTPTKQTIQRAISLARALSREGLSAPTRIVPDAHGGIVFERRHEGLFESIRISADSGVEHRVFEDSRLVCREQWSVQVDENR